MKKEMNNKGFSLVELIIVVAIMVVLVAVLAPQYLKYVEKSRVSADAQTADEFVGVMQVLASDPDVNLTKTSYKVTSDQTTGKITIDADLKTALSDAGLMDTSKDFKFQSKLFKGVTGGIEIELKYDGKIWKVNSNVPDTQGNS
ncbi:MAG: prepilin-type N-terminal cleavage/methylation domain-containing protein [Lachnospiraceae bacterium]|nr:prepilin-type N-terminal cleavage/methylation domain-containing protein [Lachnospiraceae bacterium]